MAVALVAPAACSPTGANANANGARTARPIVKSCADDLGGVWRAEGDARFRFKITDGGAKGNVVLEPLFPAGGPGTDYGAFKTTLARTPAGTLAGTTETTFTQKGKTCPVRFTSRIDSCKDGKLELAGETSFDVDVATCKLIPNGVLSVSMLVREAP